MKIARILKKIVSFILLVTFLTSSNVYSYPIKTELRPPLQTSSENIDRLIEVLNREMSTSASNQTGFTDEQKKAILEEIEKHCGN